MEYEIGSKYFSSKQAIAKCAQEILKRSDPGKVLLGDDRDFVMGLIMCHPRVNDKVGTGIKHVIARIDPVWKKGKQFLIIRSDGSVVDFSYRKCVYGEVSRFDLFRSACRTAVVEDIIAFKSTHLTSTAKCPYFGEPLTRINSHVDHVKPRTFNWIVDEFIKISGVDPGSIEIIGETQKRFKSQVTSDQFRQFHIEVAVLELVSERANQTCCKVSWKEPAEAGHKIQSRMEPPDDYQEHAATERRQQGQGFLFSRVAGQDDN